MNIAVLALQGAFAEHIAQLHRLGVTATELRQASDWSDRFDGLILPGGESTVMGRLLRDLSLFEPMQRAIRGGLPTFGTCAGLLLLAKEIENDSMRHFATMNITAIRNAYGRQLGSFRTDAYMDGVGSIPMTFIRAPYIASVHGAATALATVDGKIVAAREENQLVTAFHPELSDSTAVHDYFLKMVQGAAMR